MAHILQFSFCFPFRGLSKQLFTTAILIVLLMTTGGVHGQSSLNQVLPSSTFFTRPITNTNGNWVVNYPTEPDNINLLETELWSLPKRGLGVMGVEFKLVGGDGGTANFNNGLQNQLAYGGQGGTVQFKLWLKGSSNNYGLPFFVAYGKHGQSTAVNSSFTTGGGGGSTGMCLLTYEHSVNSYRSMLATYNDTVHLPGNNGLRGRQIAGAGGGGGGWAAINDAKAGKGAGTPITQTYQADVAVYQVSNGGQPLAGTYSGGSYRDVINTGMSGLNTAAATHGIFNYTTGFYNNTFAISSLSCGQGGGQPTYLSTSGPYTNSTLVSVYYGGEIPSVLSLGGAGGSGIRGGGAGASTLSEYSVNYQYPGGGAGAGGRFRTTASDSRRAGWGGDNYVATGSQIQQVVNNIQLTNGGITATPQSGSFAYRTIRDTIPPYASITTQGTLQLSLNYISGYGANSANQVTLPFSNIYCLANDNDSVQYTTFTKSVFTCADTGYHQVRLIAVDFAGNVDTSDNYLTVHVTDGAAPHISTYPLEGPIKWIDITNGPRAVVQSDFPTATDNCGGVVTYTWAPHVFSCQDLAGPVNISYTITDVNGNSAVLNQRFIVFSNNVMDNVYVDASATGANNGTSWENAFTNLQDAFTFSCKDNRNIYVATGTYYPDRGAGQTLNDRNATFTFRNGDKIYGGFPSGGAVFADRNPSQYPVVLSGNINNPLSSADNSYHVVTIPAGVSTILMEGITVADGRGDESPTSFGGGIKLLTAFADSLNKLTLNRCVLQNNYATGNGGAVAYPNIAFVSKVTAINSLFVGNTAGGNGGAMYSSNASIPTYASFEATNCVFRQNTAANGGAFFCQNTAALLTNCSSGFNKATVNGGAISSATSTIYLRNTVLYSDTAGSVQNEVGASGQCQFTYCNVQGSGGSSSWNNSFGVDNGFNIDVNPQYLSAFDLDISTASPCRNTGLKSLNTIATDIRGVPRVVQDTIDMGAYELNPIVFVAADAANGGDGNTWATAFNNLSDGLSAAFGGYYVKEVWIKAGTYRPDRGTNGTNQGRFNTFHVLGSTKLYGGFAGNENALSQRNIKVNPTILDGDIGIAGDSSDNAYHVVTLDGVFPGFDGLIIQNGNANHPTLAAYQSGGGIYHGGIAFAPTPSATNCVFRNNSAFNGGAIEVSNSFAGITFNVYQCLFYNNYAKFNGGAVYVLKGGTNNIDVTCNLYNCTGANNIANGYTGGFVENINTGSNGNATTNIYNSVVWGNYINQNGNGTINQDYHNTNNGAATNIFDSHVGGSNPNFTNIANPAGADGQVMTDDDGLTLQTSSTAINLGVDSNVPEGITVDLRGRARIGQGKVDAGAYENWGCLGLTTIYVDSSVVESGTGANWANAYKYLSDAIQAANICPQVTDIRVAKGTYYPSGTNTYLTSRDTAFYIKRPYRLLGGYPTGGGVQNADANPTTLSGDINSTTFNDNAYHILIIKSGTTDTTLLDGLTFTKGNASQNGNYTLDGTVYSRSSGAAVVSNNSKLHIRNCKFNNNSAFQGGAAVYSAGGFIASTNCVFETNVARYGGALRVEGTGVTPAATINANVFYKNISTVTGGGAISCFNGAFTISNNLFAYDSCNQQQGGAINITGGKSSITGNTFFKNFSVGAGGAISLAATIDTQVVANNIFYRNIDPGNAQLYTAAGVVTQNIANLFNGNLQFTDTTSLKGADSLWATQDDGLIMMKTSAHINSGNNSYATGSSDLTGASRIQHGSVDPGAYESQNIVTRWYVSALQDSATQNGLSWATAFQKFEDGVNAAKPEDSVWVAQGVYTPANSGTSFSMKNGVKIYGGFASNETDLAQRILSNGYNSVLNGNNASVISNTNIDSTSFIDGFVIQNGAAAQGGGMLNTGSSPVLNNLLFIGNQASVNGGAVANINSTSQLFNCIFYNNSAVNAGGAVYNSGSNARVINSTFYNNSSASGGAVFNNFSSIPTIGNCIFNNNAAATGADIFSTNANVSYCLLQTAISGNGNIVNDNAGFVAAFSPAGTDGVWFTNDDGWQLGYLSPALNKGSNVLSSGITTDVTGASRLQNGTIDMGAYESPMLGFCDSAALNNQHVIYVDGARASSGNGSSWDRAFRSLTEALNVANYCNSIDSILVAKGHYYPAAYQASTNRKATFSIQRSGLFLKGGYPNGGGDRNLSANNTFLNGDIGMSNNASDNSYHVLTFSQTGVSGIDGFVITNGNADSILEPFNSGGGVYVNGTTGAGNKPVISNCVFTRNQAAYGAGLYNDGFGSNRNASPTIVNCVFVDDTASINGGAIFNNARANGNASPQIINCTFARNYAMDKAGGIYDAGNGGKCATKITNSIFWSNSSATGTASQQQIYNDAATDTASYSLFQNGMPASVYDGGQNISSAPLFAADTLPIGFVNQWMNKYNGFALKINSPGLQAGNPAIAPPTDIAGISRQPQPDMGAYQNNGGGTGTVVMNATACDSLLSPGYNHYWYNSGIYTDTLFNILGCDTFYQVNLTVFRSSLVNQTISTCGSYQIPGGNYVWDSTGVYSDTLQTVNGCDSIIIINLTITSLSDSALVNGALCTAQQAGASYQWIDCTSNQPVNGATQQSFVATQNGSYACIVTDGNCTDTTNCVSVIVLGIGMQEELMVEVFPNPTTGNLILTHNIPADASVILLDNLGRSVTTYHINSQFTTLDITNFNAGIYYLQLWKNNEKLITTKVVKF
ncbi:MAG: T9SS type A sorting domain-containing protein [Chitinophagales bacterium]|nr:T9SS type A sorting domain-containing protein [Chitinophagales bacterium]